MATATAVLYSDLHGYQTTRLTADAAINGGNPVVLEAIGCHSVGSAGSPEWYEDDAADTSANKRGGLTGVSDGWEWITGLHQHLTQLYVDIDNTDSYVDECVVIWQPGQ